MKSRQITVDKMTWPEVYNKIEKAPIAFIPVGPQECHGAGMPMGTDIFVPEAVALMASEKAGGVVYDPLSYCFTGATSSFRGTVSIPMSLQMQVIKEIAKSLNKQKYEAICFLSIHGPNSIPIGMAIRELFEYDKITTGLFNPYSFIDEHEYDYNSVQKETAMCYAAMDYLGIGHLIPDIKGRNSNNIVIKTEGVKCPDSMMVGYHYTDINQHQPVCNIEIEIGYKMLEKAARKLAESMGELVEYSHEKNNHQYEFVKLGEI